MSGIQSSTFVYEIHEDRIQNLESCLNDTNATLAQQDVKLDHIVKTMDVMKVDHQEKKDKGFQEIKDEVRKTSVQIDKLHAAVQDHDERISTIERAENTRSSRVESFLKISTMVAAALIGALAKHFVDVWFK